VSARGNASCGADCYPAASESGWVVAVMVDTYGIPKVVDARGTIFGRQQIQRTPQPFVRPLTCGGRGCSAGAVAVVGYLRLQTWVEPMYRLGPGEKHSPGGAADLSRPREQSVVDPVADQQCPAAWAGMGSARRLLAQPDGPEAPGQNPGDRCTGRPNRHGYLPGAGPTTAIR
jgi:hypothetical protein